MLLRTPGKRLKSRSPPGETARKLISSRCISTEEWRKELLCAKLDAST